MIDANEIITFEDYKELTLDAVDDFNRKNFEEALKKFKKLAKKNYKNTKVHEILAYIYLELNDLENAQKEYDIFLSLFNDKYGKIQKNYTNFDDLLENIKGDAEVEELEQEVKTIIDRNEEIDFLSDIEKLYQLAILYIAEGKYKEAETFLIQYKEKYLHSSQ